MARNYGEIFPERPLMAVLSDLLGIEHFTTSKGATVRSDFLREVLLSLGGDPTGLAKDDLIRACVQQATGGFDPDLISVGGTVTNRALQTIIDGVIQRRGGSGVATADLPRADLGFGQPAEYDPATVSDERERKLSERAIRQGQDAFRTQVLTAYSGACSLTGTDAVNALEAAHITPHLGPATNVIGNGICLRADIHRLWDNGLLAIEERSLTILLAEALRATSYRDLDGHQARLPRRVQDRPSQAALAAHRRWCGLPATS